MNWDSILKSLQGPELVKLVLATILIVAFAFWQRKEAEGVMRGYIVVAAFALARDLLYFFFPQPELYRASDLILVVLLALAFALPLGAGRWLYASAAVQPSRARWPGSWASSTSAACPRPSSSSRPSLRSPSSSSTAGPLRSRREARRGGSSGGSAIP